MWVPAEMHAQIQRIGAGEGAQLIITRAKRGKAAATWSVGPVQSKPVAHERTPHKGYIAREETAPSPPPQPAAVLASSAGCELAVTAADRMAAALADSIALWSTAVQIAAEHGLRIAPDAGHVRVTAATLFLEASR